MPRWFRIVRLWLPAAIALTCACALVYGATQQVHRAAADDPQTAIATAGAEKLIAGGQPFEVAGTARLDLTKSGETFILVLDGSDAVVASNAQLDGNVPEPPAGVLDAARADGLGTVTWEPKSGLRFAVVAAAGPNDTVVVTGRSLAITEQRIGALVQMTALIWGIGMLALLAAAWALTSLRDKLAQARTSAADGPDE